MRAGFTGSLWALLLAAPFCFAQPAYVEVKLPVGVRSGTMFIQYMVDDGFGGWVQPRSGVSSYFIAIRQGGGPARRFRALIYAPGCALRTVDLPALGPEVPRYSFACEPLPNFRLTGTLAKAGRLNGHEANLQVRYVARWAQNVFGEGAVTDIPIGGTREILAGGSFQLSLPDLSKDPLAGISDPPGELRILARDRANGKIVAQLVPAVESLRTRMGGLQIRNQYPDPVEFALCDAGVPRPRDAYGFALRPDAGDSACSHSYE